MQQKQTNQFLIAAAIVTAGALMAGGIYLGNFGSGGAGTTNTIVATDASESTGSTDNIRPVTSEDHIKGDTDARIKIVTYTDFECPFCQRFHASLNEFIGSAGTDDVAWVFRHFPIPELHSKAMAVAMASECVSEQGGDEAFWKFSDRYFEVSPSNNQTNIETVIPQLVREIGLDEVAFQTCFESEKYDNRIQADIANAVETGGRGTPWSILIAPNGKTFPINGAQSIQSVQQLIELARNET
jgi:protein-disulfide isomerase